MSTDTPHTHLSPRPYRSIIVIRPGTPAYPPGVGQWHEWTDPDGLFGAGDPAAGPTLATIGCLGLLSRPSIGLLCSVRCPGSLILTTYEFAKRVHQDGAAIIGGFHSPMERTCLATLLARHVPVIYCPARRLNARGIPRAWDGAIAEQRLLVLSPFVDSQRRVTHALARQRNLLVAALADLLFVPYALRGGNTEAVVRMSLLRGKPVCTLHDGENGHLVSIGVRGLALRELLGIAGTNAQSPFPQCGKGLE
jgi:predicted Rossmann fold nucleotide-binding protein DprA/Smf involved in DNA uptake